MYAQLTLFEKKDNTFFENRIFFGGKKGNFNHFFQKKLTNLEVM